MRPALAKQMHSRIKPLDSMGYIQTVVEKIADTTRRLEVTDSCSMNRFLPYFYYQ